MRALTHSMFALLQCQEKPSGVYKMQETPEPAGRAYSAHPDPPADGEGAVCPLPKNPTRRSRPSGLACPHRQILWQCKTRQANASADAYMFALL